MKVTITLTDLSAAEACRVMEGFRLTPSVDPPAADSQPADDFKPRRRRRTKAEMDAAHATEAASSADEAAPSETEAAPTRRRRRRRPSDPGDHARDNAVAEITDADIAKAASDAARPLTPKVVLEELAKFNVTNVAALDQEQRQNFMSMLKNRVEASGNIPF